MPHNTHCLAEKAQALTLLEWGTPPRRIAEVTNFSVRHLHRLQAMARKRGYDPSVSLVIKDEYLAVAPRSGRPRKIGPEKASAAALLRGPEGPELARQALEQVQGALSLTKPLRVGLDATEDSGVGK